MSKVMNVEKRIWDVEGFGVRILHLDGRDVRGDRAGLPQYPHEHAAKNDLSVEAWKSRRFRQAYPGFQVEVMDCDGNSVHGNTRLGTVRDTYNDGEDGDEKHAGAPNAQSAPNTPSAPSAEDEWE